MTMTETVDDDLLDRFAQHGRQGSTARLAVLQHLAQHPQGATFEALGAVICRATNRVLTNPRITGVLMAMRADQQLVRERVPARDGQPDEWLWFSPASRHAAQARGQWRPATTDAAAHQAAAGIAITRGLAIDPTAD